MKRRSAALWGLVWMICWAPAAVWAQGFRNPVVGDAVVTAYYDHGGPKDWNCGGTVYGGHRGTDIAIYGRFTAMDQGRDVVAAAPGRVAIAHDGEFDRCESGNCAGGGGFGNYVAIDHPDGKRTYYGHLRKNSVRVSVGQQVTCGQKLGQVGSSGYSTGPHLHFEPRKNNVADDPFKGPCGGPISWWVSQGAYRSLPSSQCEQTQPPDPPEPPKRPDFHLAMTQHAVEGRRCDFADGCLDGLRDGPGAGVPDLWVGQTMKVEVVVTNRGDGSTAAESTEDAAIQLQWQLPGALKVQRYLIETDHPDKNQQSWRRNDAMENAANPAEAGAGLEQVLRLNGFSAGESKRVTLWLKAEEATLPDAAGSLRFWIRHVRNYYGEKTTWEGAAQTNQGQTFNGGDLRISKKLEVLDPLHFQFEQDAHLEGWRRCDPASVGALEVHEGALQIEVTGATPCVESPPLPLTLAQIAGLRLEASYSGGPLQGQLAWSSAPDDAQSPFVAAGLAPFELAGGDALEALHLGPLGPPESGLYRVRLWFDGGAQAVGQRLQVASVQLVPDAPPPPVDAEVPPAPPVDAQVAPEAAQDADGPPRPRLDAQPPAQSLGDLGFSFDPEYDGLGLPGPSALDAAHWQPERGQMEGEYVGSCAQSPGSSAPTGAALALLLGLGLWRRRR